MSEWIRIGERHPSLGMDIELRIHSHSEPVRAGKVKNLVSIGNGWISLDGSLIIGAALSPNYEWRMTESKQGKEVA